MRAARVWTLLEPRIQQRTTGGGVTLVMRQVPRLRERQQLRVAARLPQVLDIADDPLVPVVERLAEREWRDAAGLRIAVPLRRKSELRRAQGEHVELTGDDAIRRRAILARVELARQRIDPPSACRLARM